MMAPVFYIAPKLFRTAAIYGVIVLVPLYFAEIVWSARGQSGITHPEFLYGFVGAALCFQAVYWQIARHPLSYKPMMLLGVFAKLSFGVPVVLLYLAGRVGVVTLTFGLIDLVFALLFFRCWRITPG